MGRSTEKHFVWFVLGLCVIFFEIASGSEDAPRPQPEITIQIHGEWIRGLPLWTAVTVRKAQDSIGFSVATPRNSGETVSWRYEIWTKGPTPRIVGHDRIPQPRPSPAFESAVWGRLAISGETAVRQLVPFSASRAPSRSGEYELLFVFLDGTGKDLGGGVRCPITVREPTWFEKPFVDKLSESYRAIDRSTWSSAPPLPYVSAYDEIPESIRERLGFDLFLRELSAAADASSNEPRAGLLPRATEAFFAPELLAMRYEAAVVRREPEKAERLREQIRAECPGVLWMCDIASQKYGRGMVGYLQIYRRGRDRFEAQERRRRGG